MKLPTFLVIGAAKSGTTSLHFYLRQHPDIYLSPVKETNFYSPEDRMRGRLVPRSLEEYARFFAGARAERAIGEISPQYLNSDTAAARIARDLPNVRLIVSLRNPADRAYSDYLGRVRIARESRPIELVMQPGERIFDDSLYYPKLKRYFNRFPRQRVHVMLYDDFLQDSRAALRHVFAFVGVDPDFPVETSTRHNPAEAPRSVAFNQLAWRLVPALQRLVPLRWRGSGWGEALLRRTYRRAQPISPELRRRLLALYRQDVVATAELIQLDLSAWLDD